MTYQSHTNNLWQSWEVSKTSWTAVQGRYPKGVIPFSPNLGQYLEPYLQLWYRLLHTCYPSSYSLYRGICISVVLNVYWIWVPILLPGRSTGVLPLKMDNTTVYELITSFSAISMVSLLVKIFLLYFCITCFFTTYINLCFECKYVTHYYNTWDTHNHECIHPQNSLMRHWDDDFYFSRWSTQA